MSSIGPVRSVRPLAGDAGALLKAPGVAARLAIGRSTAQRLLVSGDLPVVRWGRNLAVRVGDLDAWVARQVVPARNPR